MLLVGSFRPSPIHLPTPLPSNRFCYPVLSWLTPHRYYEGSDSCSARLPGRSLRLLHLACRTSRPQPRRVPECRFHSHFSAFSEFQASPCTSKLAASRRRNGFVLLRAILSPPVALHAALGDAVTFVYTGCDRLWQGPADKASSRTHWDRRPCRSSAAEWRKWKFSGFAGTPARRPAPPIFFAPKAARGCRNSVPGSRAGYRARRCRGEAAG